MGNEKACMPLQLTVNGTLHQLAVDPRRTLLDVLRDDLQLTGTKRGCDDGACGTCVITIDGAMARACRVSAENAAGKAILTIEGLGSAGQLHPLQDAFIEADAVQCGFCTPGAIMAAKALLDRNATPTRAQIAKALGSNLCRCTGYVSILDAVERVARPEHSTKTATHALPAPAELHRRFDARDKVRGTALYAADLTMPGMLHAAILRSPHAHAEVLAIDASAARKMPGVIAVVTASDVPGANLYGRAIKDQRVFCDGRVRQIGDAVAAVAATSPEIAAAALAQIRVNYRLLPVITDPCAALLPGAIAIHEKGNLLAEKTAQWGDAEAALAQSHLVVDENYTTPFVEHAYLEPEAVLAYRDGAGRMVVRSATQHSHLHRRAVAETMGLPLEQVRIWPTVVGGAFGAKTDIAGECVAALLVLKTNCPVKIVYTRAESFAATTKRHPFTMRIRTGVTRDGKLTAIAAELLADTGAYASAGPAIMVRAFVSMVGPYQITNATIHGRVAYTNNTTAGAMRGYGATQVAIAIEAQMDIMAAKLGLDPLEFRWLNCRRTDPGVATARDVEQEAAYRQTVEAVRPYYEEARRARPLDGDGRRLRGVGIASMRYGIGYTHTQLPQSIAELDSEGRVRLYIGAMDMGQGTDTAMALIAARELSLPLDAVSVISGDTTQTPDTGASSGSRVVYTDGNAVKEAASMLRDAALATASALLNRSYETLELKNGRVAPRPETGAAGPTATLAEIARARKASGLALRFTGIFHPQPMHDVMSGSPSPYLVHVTATHVAEVEVDTRRGTVRVLRVVAAHDVGRVIYYQGLKGQIEGAVSMGIGFALKEEFIPGKSAGFEDYRIPNARETPEIIPLMVEMIDPSSGLGAKGAAECATVAVAPAILNAIANATGVRVHDLPATPERRLALMAARRAVSA